MGRSGKQERFGQIVEPHLSDALTLARWIMGNTSDAEDVVQEACLRAYRAIDSFGSGNARAWVLTIVRNTAFTWLATKRRLRHVGIDDLSTEDREHVERRTAFVEEGPPTPEAEMIALADAASVEAAISQLPETYREVLILRDIQGMHYREIAAITGTPMGTVMSRLARARQCLIRSFGSDSGAEA